jgi:hypothetical protein
MRTSHITDVTSTFKDPFSPNKTTTKNKKHGRHDIPVFKEVQRSKGLY